MTSGTWILPKQLHGTLDSVRDMEALNLDLNESSEICGRLLFVRSKPLPSQTWLRKWKRDIWTLHLYGRILRPSHTSRFTDEWTSSRAVTPANHSAVQGSGLEATTRGIYGRISQGEFDFSDPDSVSLRTSRDISHWGCPTLSKTWQEWVTEARGEYSARLNAVRRISGSESLSWPTVTTAEAGKISNQRNHGQIGLSNHPAIRGEAVTRPKMEKDRLGKERRQWPTPSAMETQDQGTNWEALARLDKGGRILRRIATIHGQADPENGSTIGSRSGPLNPRWVETLMGLPVGWTMPSCASPVKAGPTSCDFLATESYPQPPL